MALRQEQDFERPNRPEWYKCNEVIVFTDDTAGFLFLDSQVLTKNTATPVRPEIAKRTQFLAVLVRQGFIGPDLTMGMRITGAHHFAAIFEDLHGIDPIA